MSAVTGVAELDRVFNELSKGMANRIARPALNKSGRLAAKIVKNSVPSKYKGVRKAIGSASIPTKVNDGFASVKVGAGVGIRRKKRATTVKNRKGRKGVGFDARNIHWWFLGTDERTTGTKRKRVGGKRGRKGFRGVQIRVDTGKRKRRTGRMPAQSKPISVLVRRNANQLNEVIRKWVAVGVKKEVVRQAKKQL
jgi:hypothetical protein